MRLSRSWSLGGALFAAGAMRHDAAGVPSEQTLAAGVLGAGLRYIPRRSGRSMFRIDVGFPVIASRGVRRSLYVSFSASPGWSQLRQRDGHTRM